MPSKNELDQIQNDRLSTIGYFNMRGICQAVPDGQTII